jgi:hypothetical protein
MHTYKNCGLISPLLLAIVLFGPLVLGAQTKSAAQSNPKPTPPAQSATAKHNWIKDPNSVMPMRQMTNAERRAAAERNKARRTKAQRKQGTTTSTQTGGQR